MRTTYHFLPMILVVAWLAPATAGGDTSPEERARQLFKQAQVHFSLGEFDKAIKLNREAYRLKQLPALLFNIGQCYRHKGDCKNAVFFYKEFLLKEPDSPQRATVEQLIQQCEAGTTKIPPKPVAKPAQTPAAGQASSTPQLARQTEAPEAAVSQTPTGEAEGTPADQGPSSVWLWTGVGATAALLAAGAITGGIAYSKNKEYKEEGTTDERRASLKDAGRPLGIASVVSFGLAAAAATGTALYYFLVYRRPERGEPAVSAAPVVSHQGAALVLSGTF